MGFVSLERLSRYSYYDDNSHYELTCFFGEECGFA